MLFISIYNNMNRGNRKMKGLLLRLRIILAGENTVFYIE